MQLWLRTLRTYTPIDPSTEPHGDPIGSHPGGAGRNRLDPVAVTSIVADVQTLGLPLRLSEDLEPGHVVEFYRLHRHDVGTNVGIHRLHRLHVGIDVGIHRLHRYDVGIDVGIHRLHRHDVGMDLGIDRLHRHDEGIDAGIDVGIHRLHRHDVGIDVGFHRLHRLHVGARYGLNCVLLEFAVAGVRIWSLFPHVKTINTELTAGVSFFKDVLAAYGTVLAVGKLTSVALWMEKNVGSGPQSSKQQLGKL
ncbi:hypothetical protein NDN08_005730 [Rhodosorus marinus]|uniref:Uncharacterized protein n=1 Tax=Rhodosorus marinus TaxID=101924 RepID=A0AAV8V4L6_9RHOD|nr:hypothetical protein NDN08_005730 [Rhodosorus marinus]